MAILLLLFSWVGTLLIIYALSQSFREAWLKTSLIYGLMITLLTEGLSFNRALTGVSVVTFWSIVLIVNLGLGIYFRPVLIAIYRNFINNLQSHTKLHPLISKPLIGGSIGATLLICLITALIAPPNNWDSMTYHLPRVMHWMQNASVAHYPTAQLRQISFPPLSGFIITQLQLLTGGDLFANSVQWLAFLGCILANSLIVKLLISEEYQLWGALLSASIPMAIMQSTTTQNDLVVSYWLVCFVYFIVRLPDRKNYTLTDIFWLGTALGLAILTKPTAYIFGAPLVLLLCGKVYRQKDGSFLSKSWFLALFGVIALSLSIPHYLRNTALFANPLGDDSGVRNAILGLPQFISNLLRLLAINLPLPNIWIPIRLVHEYLLGISINDPNSTFADISDYTTIKGSLRFLTPHEDFVGSPLHLIFYLWSGINLFWTKFSVVDRHRFNNPVFSLFLVNLLGLFLFCFLLKWQPWGNRLFLPFFMLNTVVIVHGMQNYLRPVILKLLLIFLSLTAIVYALTPMRHPLIALPFRNTEQSRSILTLSRQDIYFSGSRKELKEQYYQIVDEVKSANCLYVGLSLSGEAWEYPLWALLQQNHSSEIKIIHLGVTNVSKQIAPNFPIDRVCKTISLS